MEEVEESRQTVSLMPEYLVVCCWRSIKEVSLLLGQLSQCVPITQPAVSPGLLSLQQVLTIFFFFFFGGGHEDACLTSRGMLLGQQSQCVPFTQPAIFLGLFSL